MFSYITHPRRSDWGIVRKFGLLQIVAVYSNVASDPFSVRIEI